MCVCVNVFLFYSLFFFAENAPPKYKCLQCRASKIEIEDILNHLIKYHSGDVCFGECVFCEKMALINIKQFGIVQALMI